MVDDVAAGSHQQADCRRRGVPNGDVVVLDDLVPPRGAEAAFVNDLGYAVGPRRHHAVGSAGYPSGVRRAEVDVVELEVECPVSGNPLLYDGLVAVQHTFRLACRT